LHAALLEGDLGHVAVGKLRRQAVDPADAVAVGDRLDVEDEDRRHGKMGSVPDFQSGKTPVER
jgi:hypothetical protein